MTPLLSISRGLHVDRSATARLVAWSTVAVSHARTRRRGSSGAHRWVDHGRRCRHMRRGVPAVPRGSLPVEVVQVPLHEGVSPRLELGAPQTGLLLLDPLPVDPPSSMQLGRSRSGWQLGRSAATSPPRLEPAPTADEGRYEVERGVDRRPRSWCVGGSTGPPSSASPTPTAVRRRGSPEPMLADPAASPARHVASAAHRSPSLSASPGSAASISSPSRGP